MGPTLSIKKQVKVALYTTPVIAALAMTPIAILGRYSFNRYLLAISLSMSLVLFLWSVNIFVWYAGARSALSRYLINILVSLSLTILVTWVMHFPGHMSGSHHIYFHFHLILFFAVNAVIIILQDLLVSRERNAAIQLENQQLKLKNVEAVNQQLKQQIQPHFLFNSLSTLKSLMNASPENAEEYLVRLSDFLRSSLSSHPFNTIQLDDELTICVNYLEMQKIRFGKALRFDIHIPDSMRAAWCLPAFSLQLLAENAIKHNILTLERPLTITISCRDEIITVSNNLQKKEASHPGTGMGLANLQERYKILSGGGIVIDTDNDKFSVSIKALPYEGSHH